MLHRHWFALLLTLALATGLCAAVAQAAPGDDAGVKFLAAVDGAVAAGELTAEDALVYKLAYGFAPDTLPARFRPARIVPLKCGTAIVAQYARLRPTMGSARVKQIDAWLAPRPDPVEKATYVSPGGHFTLTYSTTGTNAVPTTDTTPANGIPDYVEKVAGYCDYSWSYEVTTLGFAAPPTSGATYQINFENMSYYGYTTPVTSPTGSSRITLHNTFLGFPTNTDPEGNQWGAAKVTVAHEFKHATQRAGSLWSEGDWVELDATWMEDIAYDYVNDYYNYLPSGSPISAPGTSLDGGSGAGGSYEDCIWQHWMSETYGVGIIVELWNWRKTHQGETLMTSYNQMLVNHGTSVALGWPTFAGWNYATGTRGVTGLGYGEASAYPTGPVTTISSYPGTASGTVAYEAAGFVRCNPLPTGTGSVRVQFNGANASLVRLMAVITRTNGTGLLEPVTLDAANDADAVLSVPLNQIAALGFAVSNGAVSGVAQAWSLTVSLAPTIPALTLSQASLSPSVSPGQTVTAQLDVTNSGQAGSTLHYTVTPMAAVPVLAAKSIAGANVVGSPTAYTPGTTGTLALTVTNPSTDTEWLVSVALDFPAGITVNSSTNFTGGAAGPLVTNGATGDGAIVTWADANGGYGNIYGGGATASATVNVTFAPGLLGAQNVAFTINGDVYGAAPHTVTSQFTLTGPAGPTLTLTAPAGGELWAIGSTHPLTWSGTGSLADVRLEASRDGGTVWETIVASTPNDGACDWSVTGPATPALRVRVASLDGVTSSAGAANSLVYEPAPWLSVTPAAGALAQGASDPLTVGCDATALTTGTYHGVLYIRHDAEGSPASVSVDLTVRAPTGVGDAPAVLRLAGNQPNPFNPATAVSFSLARAGLATLEVLDLRGRSVRLLLRAALPAGPAVVRWDGRDDAGRLVPSGAYLARLTSAGQVASLKMMLTK